MLVMSSCAASRVETNVPCEDARYKELKYRSDRTVEEKRVFDSLDYECELYTVQKNKAALERPHVFSLGALAVLAVGVFIFLAFLGTHKAH
jgi:hypothetical protein